MGGARWTAWQWPRGPSPRTAPPLRKTTACRRCLHGCLVRGPQRHRETQPLPRAFLATRPWLSRRMPVPGLPIQPETSGILSGHRSPRPVPEGTIRRTAAWRQPPIRISRACELRAVDRPEQSGYNRSQSKMCRNRGPGGIGDSGRRKPVASQFRIPGFPL